MRKKVATILLGLCLMNTGYAYNYEMSDDPAIQQDRDTLNRIDREQHESRLDAQIKRLRHAGE